MVEDKEKDEKKFEIKILLEKDHIFDDKYKIKIVSNVVTSQFYTTLDDNKTVKKAVNHLKWLIEVATDTNKRILKKREKENKKKKEIVDFEVSDIKNSEGIIKGGWIVSKSEGSVNVTALDEHFFDLEKIKAFKEKHKLTKVTIEDIEL